MILQVVKCMLWTYEQLIGSSLRYILILLEKLDGLNLFGPCFEDLVLNFLVDFLLVFISSRLKAVSEIVFFF